MPALGREHCGGLETRFRRDKPENVYRANSGSGPLRDPESQMNAFHDACVSRLSSPYHALPEHDIHGR